MPKTVIGPDRSHRMPVKLTMDSTAVTASIDRMRVVVTKSVTSTWMRWSGLSTGGSTNRSR